MTSTLHHHDNVVTCRHEGDVTVRTSVNPAYLFLQEQMERIPQAWAHGDGKTIFEGRNQVREMTICNVALAVKRYRRLSGIKSIIYTYMRPSKAMRAFIYSLEYLHRGIPTPEGVAAVEVYRHNLLTDSYFISILSPGKMLFPELVLADNYDPVTARQVADFIYLMHSRGVINRDPNLKNILSRISPRDGTRTLEAIDINRSVFTDSSFPRKLITRNLARITHRRSLLMHIVERYALRAGESPRQLTDEVMAALDNIERNRDMRHGIRDLFRHT